MGKKHRRKVISKTTLPHTGLVIKEYDDGSIRVMSDQGHLSTGANWQTDPGDWSWVVVEQR